MLLLPCDLMGNGSRGDEVSHTKQAGTDWMLFLTVTWVEVGTGYHTATKVSAILYSCKDFNNKCGHGVMLLSLNLYRSMLCL